MTEEEVTLVGCFAHLRRYFFEAVPAWVIAAIIPDFPDHGRSAVSVGIFRRAMIGPIICPAFHVGK